MNYYNEFDPKTAAWLRELIKAGAIPDGHVDERSIADVSPSDLKGYVQCHFFAGIGGWSLALQLAGWPENQPVWTGSCPCQPFSTAGKGLAQADERHLWPTFFNLIRECRPEFVFGEQVASAIGKGWLDGVSSDLESESYACGASVLGAHSVGAPHIRQRLYWLAYAKSLLGVCERGYSKSLSEKAPIFSKFRNGHAMQIKRSVYWHASKPPVLWLANGLSRSVVLRGRGYGNAIVPQVAAEFICASIEALNDAQ